MESATTRKLQFCYSNPTFSWKEPWKFHVNPPLFEAFHSREVPAAQVSHAAGGFRIHPRPSRDADGILQIPGSRAGCDRSSSGSNPQITPQTPLLTPPLQGNPIYHPGALTIHPPHFPLPNIYKNLFWAEVNTRTFNTKNY